MNIEEAVSQSFNDLGFGVTRTGTNLQALITEHGCVIRTSQVGGPVNGIEGNIRCVIEVYAATYRAMWDAASAVTTRLVGGSFRAGPVLIDAEVCESSFAERPYTEGTRVVTSTWVLTARHHTRIA